jgi:formylglycine-generating enzyme required for sulfatase activity
MLRAAVIVLLLALLPSHARGEARIALLIGNEAYASEIGRLANPHNDIALLEGALKGLGFEVVTVRDAGLGALTRAVNAYARRLQAAGPNAIGFFYYSGHGASDGTTNYLIPVDVKTTETGELWDESLRLTEVTRRLKAEAGNAAHFVVFDACRNTLKLTQPGSRAVVQSKGFVPVVQENGMLIAYATAEGELASDVGAGAGPYAKVLAEEIVKPGIEAVVMFRAVQRRVRVAIRQEPYLGFNALGDVYLAGKDAKPPELAPTQARQSEAAEAWAAAKDTNSVDVLEDFIRRYKDTFYAGLARARIDDLKRQQVAVVVPPKAPEPASQTKPAMTTPPTPPPARCDGIEVAVGQNERRCFKPGAGNTEQFKDCPTCPEMVVVPAGSFMMGSPANEQGRNADEARVRVSIPAPFAVGRFAVTFDEWDACVAAGGCYGKHKSDEGWGRGKHPVINVTWHDAYSYAEWLSGKTGKTYRLLSEAEREYVTRAGTTTPFWWGASITPKQANYDGDAEPYEGGGFKGEYRQRTVPVDSFEPNPWGLYNVHGNVWDWTEDYWNDSNIGNSGDGQARTTTTDDYFFRRVIRGGSWGSFPRYLRSALRDWGSAGVPNHIVGFRLARTLAP